MFSSAGAQPISLKSFRGLGDFPNKIARVYKHEHCLPKKRNGRKSMAAQPFILTIDGVRPFCYKIRLIVSRRITMRAPFQILAIPYRIVDGTPKVHIEYDLVGYIPVVELLKAEQA